MLTQWYHPTLEIILMPIIQKGINVLAPSFFPFYFALVIPLNKNYNELKALNDEKPDNLIKTYDQLQMLIIDEILLINNRMLTFIDYKLCDIKQYTTNLWVALMLYWCIGDFYQASSIQDLWIFKLKTNAFNILGTIFW